MIKNMLSLVKKRHVNEAEVYFSMMQSLSFSTFNGTIDSYKNSIHQGYSLRVKHNGKVGYAYSEMMDDKSLEKCVECAIGNAAHISKLSDMKFVAPQEYVEINNYNPVLFDVSFQDKKNVLLAIEQEVSAMDERIHRVQFSYYEGTSEVAIGNTSGLDLHSKSNFGYVVMTLIAQESKETVVDYDVFVFREFSKSKILVRTIELKDKVLSKLNATKIPSGNYKCIIDSTAMSDLFDVLTSQFYQDRINKGLSSLKGKLNEPVYSSKITLVDDPHLVDGFNSCGFDHEGNATKVKEIVKDGVLMSFFNDQVSATEAGVTPSGNGFKSSYASKVSVSPTNFYVVPGTESLESMIEEMNEGVVITSLGGLHAGVNPLTCEFSLEASGYYVKDGKRIKSINLITIAANFNELMNRVVTIGKDFEFNSSGVGSPAILFSSIAVSGE